MIRHDVSAMEVTAMVRAEFEALDIGQVRYEKRTGIHRRAIVGILRKTATYLRSYPAVSQMALLFGYDRDTLLIATGNLTPALAQFVMDTRKRDPRLVRAAHDAVQYRRRMMR